MRNGTLRHLTVELLVCGAAISSLLATCKIYVQGVVKPN